MSRVAGVESADYVYTARRNNSLSSSGRLFVFSFILTVSLGIALAFSLLLGAWPILPFAGLDMDRHAGDDERITIQGDNVAVEVQEGRHVTRLELNRYWARVVCDADGGRLALRSHGREIEVGKYLCAGERADMARELARELRRI
jgi:uncharacterized membrane protein